MSGEKEKHRSSIKVHDIFNNYPNWKAKLRENCFKRIREDRSRLLRTSRAVDAQDYTLPPQSGFQDIVSDELRRLKGSALNENLECSTRSESSDDALWEYDGLHTAYQGDCEELLLEMQRIYYEDLRKDEESRKESELAISSYDEEVDEYLSQLVYKHMQLNHEKEVIWCPVCKQGELQENHHLIYCNLCLLKLNRDDEINLDMMCTRLAEAHTEHLDNGCILRPEFCIENQFHLTALYIRCQGCDTFEIVA